MENLLVEIEILKQIKHEHIVQLKDFQVSTGTILLIYRTLVHIFDYQKVDALCSVVACQIELSFATASCLSNNTTLT